MTTGARSQWGVGWAGLLALLAMLAAGCEHHVGSGAAPGDPSPSGSPDSVGVRSATVTFAAVADVQYCDCRAKHTRHYRRSVGKLRAAMTTIRASGAEFVISVGDIIDHGFDSYARILPELRVPGAGDRYFVLGNHEWNVDDAERSRVLDTLGLASPRYCFGINGWRFIVTDGTELSSYATEPGSERRVVAEMMLEDLEETGAENARRYNGALSPEQLLWLHDELVAAQAAGERAIVFGHLPVYPPEAHGNSWNDGDVRWVLEQFPGVVVAHISGHEHRGGWGEHGGVYYLTLHGMVETESTTAFVVVHLHDDRIEVEGHGRQPSGVLPLRPSPAPGTAH